MNGWTYPILILAAILFVLAILSGIAHADPVLVKDGDTIVWNGEKIRMFGIDAPEKNQAWGPEARAALLALVAQAGPAMRVDRRGKDRYGRTLAIVFDGRKSLNAAMVYDGHAWAYVEFSTSYVSHERAARAARRGLWAVTSPCPIPPWQWRNG